MPERRVAPRRIAGSARRRASIAAHRAVAPFRRADLAVFHEFAPPPSGGGNQFLAALVGELARRGLRVERNTISGTTRACLYNSFNFDFERLRRLARDGCRMVHRVDGPIGVYRGFDDGTDGRIWEINAELADATVFQSLYSLDAHRELGVELAAPAVIHNAVDPALFHPGGRVPFSRRRPLRLVSVSWSDNPNKGGPVYRRLERELDPRRFEYTFVGRSSEPLERAKVVPPVPSGELAKILRANDVLVTASRNEACPNVVLEALACGLPVVYLDSGAHRELIGEAGLPFTAAEEIPEALERVAAEYTERQGAIRVPGLAEVADRYLDVLGLGTDGA